MGFKEVGGGRQYRGWRDWSAGDFIIGKYVAEGEQDSAYGIQQWFDIDVEESNFSYNEGQMFRLNGCGSLNSKMENICVGKKVKIVFNEFGTLTKGAFKGKEFADISVFEAEEEGESSEAPKNEATSDYSGL